jgi:hypothetical protein
VFSFFAEHGIKNIIPLWVSSPQLIDTENKVRLKQWLSIIGSNLINRVLIVVPLLENLPSSASAFILTTQDILCHPVGPGNEFNSPRWIETV